MPIASAGARYTDPRNVVTEDAFRVAPELLGTPLARPWRRGVAMAVDGLLIALLSNASGVLFGLAAAAVLFRVSARGAGQGYVRRSFRLMLRFSGAVVLFVIALNLWDGATDRVARAFHDDEAPEVASEASAVPVSGFAGLRTAADVMAFTRASTPDEARERAPRLVSALHGAGMEEAEIREMLTALSDETDKPWLVPAVDSVLTRVGQQQSAEHALAELREDSLAAAFAAAAGTGDSARAAALRHELALSLAADTLTRLNSQLSEVRRERSQLARRLDAAQEDRSGVLATLASLAEDLGLGLGWSGLYFTAMVALWRGQTPGKRLMRIRVIRLDGKPIGWWAAFERFGGYAAGVATGLLGFFQIYWDDNRQAVHDRVSGTVVVKE